MRPLFLAMYIASSAKPINCRSKDKPKSPETSAHFTNYSLIVKDQRTSLLNIDEHLHGLFTVRIDIAVGI